MREVWVGADPGGKGRFGLAFLDRCGGLSCDTVSSVDEAVRRIVSNGRPLGLGIDAPMWWSSGEGGGRKADEWIREEYGVKPGTVQTANSLRGAALAGGAMLAYRIRQKFPGTRITETHPKAALYALDPDPDVNFQRFAELFAIRTSWQDDHQRDATVCAVCAREGFEGRRRADLALQRHRSEQDPFSYWLAPMHYYWPAFPDSCRVS